MSSAGMLGDNQGAQASVTSEQAVTGATGLSPSRNAVLDGLKYLAAAAIVLHHSAAASYPGRLRVFLTNAPLWGLFFFFIVSGYLHGSTGGRGPDWLRKRLVRLGLPYAFWSIVYLVLQLNGVHHDLHSPPDVLSVVFFAGGHGILWTLPMLFYSAVLVELLVRSVLARRIAIVTCLVLMVVLLQRPFDFLHPAAAAPSFLAAPQWLLAYLLGMELKDWGDRVTMPWPLVSLAPTLMVAAGVLAVVQSRFGASDAVSLALVGLWIAAAFLLCWWAASRPSLLGVEKLGVAQDYLIGIYVTHVFWLAAWGQMVPSRSMPSFLWIAAAWSFVFAGANLTTYVMKSFKWTRGFVT